MTADTFVSSAVTPVEVCPAELTAAGSSGQTERNGGTCIAVACRYPGIIYCLTSPSGKQYVGQTRRSFEARLRAHRKSASGCRAINAALNKYGMNAFRKEKLLVGVPSCLLDNLERLTIYLFGTLSPRGYNLVSGGNAGRRACFETRVRCKTISPASRCKISNSVKALWADPEYREKMLDALHSEEQRLLRSERAKEWWKRPEKRARMVADFAATRETQRQNLKKALSTPEAKARKSAASRRNYENPKFRGPQIEALLKLRNSPEVESRRLKSIQKMWADPVRKAQLTDQMRQGWADPVRKAQRLEKMRKTRESKKCSSTTGNYPQRRNSSIF